MSEICFPTTAQIPWFTGAVTYRIGKPYVCSSGRVMVTHWRILKITDGSSGCCVLERHDLFCRWGSSLILVWSLGRAGDRDLKSHQFKMQLFVKTWWLETAARPTLRQEASAQYSVHWWHSGVDHQCLAEGFPGLADLKSGCCAAAKRCCPSWSQLKQGIWGSGGSRHG